MSKRTPLNKEQARERRNRLLQTAAAAELSLTQGVREMRAIAGMTQEEFARHRGVSARVIKAIETGQGNPTVATLNRIGEFFGLEVAFVPVRRKLPSETPPSPEITTALPRLLRVAELDTMHPATALDVLDDVVQAHRNALDAVRQQMAEAHEALGILKQKIEQTGGANSENKSSDSKKGKQR